MGKAQKWLEVEPSTQTGFQKKFSGTSGQKLHKKRYQRLFSCLDIVSLIFSTIASWPLS